ncbi:MAG: hypothetical protein M3136_13320 [Thermoproteota archaeon]|nr:hypothetical protein [Thermoproteota archaeon]
MQDQRPLQLSLQQRAYSRSFKRAAQISINMPKNPPQKLKEKDPFSFLKNPPTVGANLPL